MRFLGLGLLLIVTNFSAGHSQVPDTTYIPLDSLAGTIKVVSRLDRSVVPLNRTVRYTVQVRWSGDLQRYEVEEVETRGLSNLEIMENASASWVGDLEGQPQQIRSYEFTLKPLSLGMAYVNGAVVTYRDHRRDASEHLATNRLGVEVVEPVAEGDTPMWLYATVALLLFAGLGWVSWAVVNRRRGRQRAQESDAQPQLPLEEVYLTELEEMDPTSPSSSELFSALSRLFRRYLGERYGVASVEMTTEEILTELRKRAIAEPVIDAAGQILRTCDVARFAAGGVDEGTAQQVYGAIQRILEKHKADYAEMAQPSRKG